VDAVGWFGETEVFVMPDQRVFVAVEFWEAGETARAAKYLLFVALGSEVGYKGIYDFVVSTEEGKLCRWLKLSSEIPADRLEMAKRLAAHAYQNAGAMAVPGDSEKGIVARVDAAMVARLRRYME
jgi:hypothetical protein